MTTWGHARTRHDLWLCLKNLADELQYIADQWLLYDLEIREFEADDAMLDYYEPPIGSPSSSPHRKRSNG